MKLVNKNNIQTLATAVVVILLTACATTLAPIYDKAIVDGLVTSNTKLMEHFASTSSGITKDTFYKREKTYNSLIGSFDGLTIQAKSRPIPKNDGGNAPSATALEGVSKTIVKMRDTDKKQGVTAMEVAAFKDQIVIYLDQALTYESFLKR